MEEVNIRRRLQTITGSHIVRSRAFQVVRHTKDPLLAQRDDLYCRVINITDATVWKMVKEEHRAVHLEEILSVLFTHWKRTDLRIIFTDFKDLCALIFFPLYLQILPNPTQMAIKSNFVCKTDQPEKN